MDSPSEGYVMLNTDGSILENIAHAGSGGLIRNHNGDWVVGYSNFTPPGDATLVEMRAIKLGLSLCHDLSFKRDICDSDYLDSVNIINDSDNHPFHCYASLRLDIRESMGDFEDITLVHILREQNKCVDFLVKDGAHSIVFAYRKSLAPRFRVVHIVGQD